MAIVWTSNYLRIGLNSLSQVMTVSSHIDCMALLTVHVASSTDTIHNALCHCGLACAVNHWYNNLCAQIMLLFRMPLHPSTKPNCTLQGMSSLAQYTMVHLPSTSTNVHLAALLGA